LSVFRADADPYAIADRERGSATVLAAAMLVVLVAVAMGGVTLGSAVIARHRAQAAADLAALAAAGRLALGGDAACASAAPIAQRMGGTIASCVIEDLDVVVSVNVAAELGRWGLGTARAAARAGPVDARASR
jgi:secretion/DNA translocation related TadE-like protein